MEGIKIYKLDLTKPFALIDMDGTAFDIDTPFAETLADIAPQLEQVPLEKLTDYHIENLYPAQHRPFLKAAWRTPGLFARAKPYPEALDALAKINEYVNMFICSTPRWDNPTCVNDKRAAIAKYFGEDWLKNKRLVLTDDKTLVFGHYLLDDKPDIKGSIDPFWEQIVYSQPWNQHIRDKRRFNWQNWQEILTELL